MCLPGLQSWEELGNARAQGWICSFARKIRKNRMGEEHKLLFDFSLPWEYFSSGFQTEKKPNPNPRKTLCSKAGELEAIFCSFIWQHHPHPPEQELSLWPWEVGSFTLVHKEEQVWSDIQVTLSPLSTWPVTRHCGDELGKYCVTGIVESLSFLHSEMTVPALRSHVISRWFSFA